MSDATDHDRVLRELSVVLSRAPADRAIYLAADRLGRAVGGRLRIWLIDYRQGALRPPQSSVEGEQPPVDYLVDDSWLGRAYAAQAVLRPDGDAAAVVVPLTIHGDRLGVLQLQSSRPVEAPAVELLEAAMPLLAQAALSVARLTDVLEWQRRRQLMTVAAEMQWSMLPGRSYHDADVTVSGMLEPAYSVAGDAYDWTRNGDVLHLAVLNGSGHGVPAALTSTLALSALRNARRAGVSLADQAALTDQALYAHHGGGAFISALLLQCDLTTGALAVVDAGSPMLLRVRAGEIEHITLDAQLPLGMFEESVYAEQQVQLEPGDRLVIVSDGVHTLRLGDGSTFSEERLERALSEARLLTAPEAARHLMRLMQQALTPSSSGEIVVEDDAVVLVVDWHPDRTTADPLAAR